MSQEVKDVFDRFASILREELKTEEALKIFFLDELGITSPKKIMDFLREITVRPYYVLLEFPIYDARGFCTKIKRWIEYSSKYEFEQDVETNFVSALISIEKTEGSMNEDVEFVILEETWDKNKVDLELLVRN
jgi:hypothetical protein